MRAPAPDQKSTGGPGHSVLIVDDEAELRAVFSEFLRDRGVDVIEAANGLEALLQVKRARPRAVVLDITMPRLGGLEALKHIRAFDPSITVIIVSGVVDDELERRARALGARSVLAKPIALADLWRALGGSATGPLAPTECQAPSPWSAPSSGLAVAPAARVLVIDDDPAVGEVLGEFLRTNGYATRVAVDGVGGMAAVMEDTPDVVLLDIEMPGLNGVAALNAIRAMSSEPKVIMVSGTVDENLAKRALAEGAFDYVTKPIDFARLTQSLETAVMMNQLERETRRPETP
jgi:two-component system, sensor histidine kinase and response regulator